MKYLFELGVWLTESFRSNHVNILLSVFAERFVYKAQEGSVYMIHWEKIKQAWNITASAITGPFIWREQKWSKLFIKCTQNDLLLLVLPLMLHCLEAWTRVIEDDSWSWTLLLVFFPPALVCDPTPPPYSSSPKYTNSQGCCPWSSIRVCACARADLSLGSLVPRGADKMPNYTETARTNA